MAEIAFLRLLLFHRLPVLGTIFNACAIALGAIIALTSARSLPAAIQHTLKQFLGLAAVVIGLLALWAGISQADGLIPVLRHLVIVIGAMILGKWVGSQLRIQKQINHLGRYAQRDFQSVQPHDPDRFSRGWVTCAILFCLGPFAIPGALLEGFQGDFKPLLLKGIMDSLAAMDFARTYGWGVVLSAIPVLVYQGTLTLLGAAIQPWLIEHHLLPPLISILAILICAIALMILGGRQIEWGNYLPALPIAALASAVW